MDLHTGSNKDAGPHPSIARSYRRSCSRSGGPALPLHPSKVMRTSALS